MKPLTSLKITLFAFFALYGSVLFAQDYTWTSADELVSITAVPAYDPQTQVLTNVVVTLSDKTLEAATPYVYPAPLFTYTVADIAAKKKQTVTPVDKFSTVNGTMWIQPLQSSPASTFLLIDLFYGVDVVQARHATGSILEIPLVSDGQ